MGENPKALAKAVSLSAPTDEEVKSKMEWITVDEGLKSKVEWMTASKAEHEKKEELLTEQTSQNGIFRFVYYFTSRNEGKT